MKILPRYLAKTVLEATFIVTLIILALEICFVFLAEFRTIGDGSYTLFSAFIYVLLDLPAKLYLFFPMIGLLGILLGLGILANHHELVILRSSGVSIFQIDWMIIKIAIFMIVVMTIVGEWLAPWLEYTADNYKISKTSNGQIYKTIHGLWIRDKNNFVYIDRVFPKGNLLGVLVYEFDKNHRLVKSFVAKNAVYQKPYWNFKNITESSISEQQITTKHYSDRMFSMSLNPKWIEFSSNEPEDLSLKQLINYIQFLESNHLKDANYNFAFWSRILQPFATLTMMLLAVPFAFGPLRSTTRGLRLLIGILLAFTFYILNKFFGPLSVFYEFPPLLAASLPTLIFAVLGGFLSYKVNKEY